MLESENRDRSGGGIAVDVDCEATEKAIAHTRLEQLGADGRARAIRAGDRVEQEFGRLGGVDGGDVDLCAGLRRTEVAQERLPRGSEPFVHEPLDAHVRRPCCRPSSLEEKRCRQEAVAADHWNRRQGAPQRRQHLADVRVNQAAEENRLRVRPPGASGEHAEAWRVGVPASAVDDSQSQAGGGARKVGGERGASAAVVDDEDSLRAELLGKQRVGSRLWVVRRH